MPTSLAMCDKGVGDSHVQSSDVVSLGRAKGIIRTLTRAKQSPPRSAQSRQLASRVMHTCRWGMAGRSRSI